jgi:hypothetical protein
MVTGKLGWRLAGWFARSSRDICVVPDGFSRAGQERDRNLAPKNFARQS